MKIKDLIELNKFYSFGKEVLPLCKETIKQLFKLIPLIREYYPKARDVSVENFFDPEDGIEILSVIIYPSEDEDNSERHFNLILEAAKRGIDIFIMTSLRR